MGKAKNRTMLFSVSYVRSWTVTVFCIALNSDSQQHICVAESEMYLLELPSHTGVYSVSVPGAGAAPNGYPQCVSRLG